MHFLFISLRLAVRHTVGMQSPLRTALFTPRNSPCMHITRSNTKCSDLYAPETNGGREFKMHGRNNNKKKSKSICGRVTKRTEARVASGPIDTSHGGQRATELSPRSATGTCSLPVRPKNIGQRPDTPLRRRGTSKRFGSPSVLRV